MKRILAVALVTAVGLTLIPSAAFAVNSEFALEVGQLDACSVGGDYGPDAGGWDSRNFTSRGTARGPEDIPVRAKSMRVGEPCLAETGSYLYVPMLFSDVPLSMVDLDDDGMDDPMPGSGECISYGPHSAAEIVADDYSKVMGASVACSIGVLGTLGAAPPPVFQREGEVTLSVELTEARTAAITIGAVHETESIVGLGLMWFCLSAGGIVSTGGQISVGNDVSHDTDGGETITRSCAVGSSFYALVSRSQITGGPAGQFMWGVVYRGGLGDAGGDVTGWFGGTQGADIHVVGNSYAPSGVPAVPASEVVCRSIYGDLGSRVTLPIEYWVSGFFGHIVPAVQEDNSVVWSGWGEYPIMAPLPADCTYLESISLTVCAPSGYGMEDWLCSILVWTADRALGKIPYTDDDPWVELCELTPLIPACIPILFPEPTDYTDFALVCADAPEPSWSDWGWLFAWVGHMAECLFVPQGGVDYRGHIQAQYDRIGISVMTESANQFADALRLQGGQCGPIIDSNLPHLGQVTLNTCSWDVYSDVRNTLGAGIILLSIIWGLSVLIGMAESLFGRKGDFPLNKDDRQV